MFGHKLTDIEIKVLSVFSEEEEIGCPVGCGLSIEDTMRVLLNLTKKDIIVGRSPYRLTKLGKRLVTEINKENKKEKQD